MKLMDFLKKYFGDLDREVDVSDLNTSKLNEVVDENMVDDVDDKSTVEVLDEEKEVENLEKTEIKQEDTKMALPKYDEKTGLFTGLNDVENEDLRNLLKSVNTSVRNKQNQEKINGAIKTKVDSLKLIDGVTSDVVMKLLDTTGIKVQDDEVVGVNEAFDNLVKSQAGLFKADKETKQEPSPMLEGFSKPMDKTSPFSEDDVIALAYGQ